MWLATLEMLAQTHARLHVKYPLSTEFNPTSTRQQIFGVIKNIISYRIKQFIIYNNTLAIKLTKGNNSARGFINLIFKARRCRSLSTPLPPPKKKKKEKSRFDIFKIIAVVLLQLSSHNNAFRVISYLTEKSPLRRPNG
jgi:hypothetical protein